MSGKEAKIRLGVEGASEAKSNVKSVEGAFGSLINSLQNVKKLGIDTAKAITDIKPFDPGRAIRSAEETRLSIQRLATYAGTSVEVLTQRFDGISQRLGISTQEVSSLATELDNLTFDPKGSVEALEALGVEANNSNRSLREMLEIGAALHNNLRVPLEGVGRELTFINRMAGEVGTQGGGKGLQKMIADLGPEMSRFEVSTEGSRRRLEAFVALVGGKLPHQQATDAASSVLGALSGNAQGIGRYLGRDIHNAAGEVDVGALLGLQRKINQTRDPKARLRVLTQLFGGDRKAALGFASIGSMDAVEDVVTGREEAAFTKSLGIKTPGIAAYDLSNITESQRRRIDEAALGPDDKLMQTAAGEALQVTQERDVAERHGGEELLKAKDFRGRQYKGDGAARLTHDTMVNLLPAGLGDVVSAVDSLEAYSNRNRLPTPTGKTGRDVQMDRLIQETQRTNQILSQQPAAIGQQVRQDPNARSVDTARSRPSN